MLFKSNHLLVKKYTASYYDIWNTFIKESKQATFLFHRDFIEYHSDRFIDFSLMVFKNNELLCTIPANRVENELHSHQGLTYGGIFISEEANMILTKEILDAVFSFIKSQGIKKLVLKKMASFYRSYSVNLWDFITKNYKPKLIINQKLLCIDYSDYKIHKTKLKHYRKGLKQELVIKKELSFKAFWNKVLLPCLLTKHNSKPVHSLKEIEYLHSLFPENILQYNVYIEDEIVAGITLFDKGDIVKSQYGAATSLGEKTYALDFLFVHLIMFYAKKHKNYFSMGTISTKNEQGYSLGLQNQKMELGCKEYPFEFFQINLND